MSYISEYKLLEHLKKLGLNEDGIKKVEWALKHHCYNPEHHNVEKFYQD